MPEYIEREALIAKFEKLGLGENSIIEKHFANGVYAVIETFPSADVVEVVRCKDCEYCEDRAMSGLWCTHPDNRNPLGCRKEDYCSDGKRKE